VSPDDNRQLGHLTEQFRHDDVSRTPDRAPARGASGGRPEAAGNVPRSGGVRRPAAWLVLAAAGCSLASGILLAQGLLIAGGLILAGLSGHLFDPGADPVDRGPRRRVPPTSR
jgi:hypothetical protein